MEWSHEKALEIGNRAIQYEREGREILLEARDKACKPLSKATFEFLAEQELEHIQAIEQYLDSILGGKSSEITVREPLALKTAAEAITKLFEDFRQKYGEVACTAEERTEIYKTAMEMERTGYALYSSAAAEATDDTSREFYKFLAAEESQHFQILQDTHTFLEQPDAVMAIEERWMQI